MEAADNIDVIFQAGRALGTPIRPLSTSDVIVIPRDYVAVAVEKAIEPYLAAPRRVKAKVDCDRADTFIEYTNLYKTPVTRIFASAPPLNAPKIQSVIDYHAAGGVVDETGAANDARWCEHRAVYEPAFTPEWTRILTQNKQQMDQTRFLEFIEENLSLIVDPAGATMLELVGTLEAKNHIDCSSTTRLQSGAIRLAYSEEVSLKGVTNTQQGSMDFPNEMILGVPPFDGGAAYKIKCRMRYRIGGNRKITIWYELVDLHLVIKDAVETIIKSIEEKTGLKVLYGKF